MCEKFITDDVVHFYVKSIGCDEGEHLSSLVKSPSAEHGTRSYFAEWSEQIEQMGDELGGFGHRCGRIVLVDAALDGGDELLGQIRFLQK